MKKIVIKNILNEIKNLENNRDLREKYKINKLIL